MVPAIELGAGANISLTGLNPLISDIIVGFGWNVVAGLGPVTELVPSAVMVDANGHALSDEHMVFFNQLSTPDGSAQYVVGADQEQIDISLRLIPENVEKIVFIVYADPELRNPGNFSVVRNAYIHVMDEAGSDIVRYNLTQQPLEVTAMVFGELYRHKGAWKFRAVGQGFQNGLQDVAAAFKIGL